MQVREVMTSAPGTCREGDSAADAARIMLERDCGSVPIVDRVGSVIGIVTDRDICLAAYAQNKPPTDLRLGEIMTRHVCTCEEEDDVFDAEREMRAKQIRRLPVVHGDGRISGIVSLGDLAQNVAKNGSETRPEGRELLDTLAAVSEPRDEIRIGL